MVHHLCAPSEVQGFSNSVTLVVGLNCEVHQRNNCQVGNCCSADKFDIFLLHSFNKTKFERKYDKQSENEIDNEKTE